MAENKSEIVNEIVYKWIKIAEKDLLTAKQGLEAEVTVTETICFHCQQAVEKF